MKRVVSFLFLTFVVAMSQGHAGLLVNVNVDEFGNGSTDFGSPLHSLPSGLIADPSGGLPGAALVYLLPFPVVDGDVQLNEIVGTNSVLSDVIRFVTSGNTSFMIFYSDNGDGVDAPADTGLPQNALTNVLLIQEVGPEGANGALYSPAAGQPGFISTDFSPAYNIVSDSAGVPEPGSMLLMAAGLAGLGLRRFYRR